MTDARRNDADDLHFTFSIIQPSYKASIAWCIDDSTTESIMHRAERLAAEADQTGDYSDWEWAHIVDEAVEYISK